MALLRQYVPSSTCFSCDVCCRFVDEDSSWRPVFTEREMRELVCLEQAPPCVFSDDKKIKTVAYKDMYVCPFFTPDTGHCAVYPLRPFDCQLYPFMLTWRHSKDVFLTVDTKCPFIKKTLKSDPFVGHTKYLLEYFSSDAAVGFIGKNSHLVSRLKDDVVFIAPVAALSARLHGPA